MSFALYRLPYADTYTEIRHDGEPLILYALEDLQDKEGFVIAPFNITEKTPLILIPSKESLIEEKNIKVAKDIDKEGKGKEINPISESYKKDFEKFHGAIAEGRFAKLVLARTSEQPKEGCDLSDLFFSICEEYPRAMVILFSSTQSGTWLMATPEILLDKQKSLFRTMALAGTMPYDEGLPQWSEKNKHEQNIVERYIEGIITPLCTQIIKDGPQSVRAGNLVHLRTDFRFHINNTSVGELISKLHPTPAVCGLPKEEARDFILKNESTKRKYYSGFAGPLNLNGETHLYVSLRCMNIQDDKIVVYAGGGIMKESVVEDEWKETELKLIRRV